jgi:uncharacterized protein (UPF0276 family)
MSVQTKASSPAVGLGFRLPIWRWIFEHLERFDVLEITVDHYIHGGDRTRCILRELVGQIPLLAHGVGLSIGTDVPIDERYLEQVATTLQDLKMTSYSEHLAWTKAPDIDLANLLPLPKNNQVADSVIEKVKFVQSYLSVPFSLENISYVFDYPDSVLTDAQFFNLICRETGARMLLDLENLYVNSANHQFDASEFLAGLLPNIVSGIHVAGGPAAISRPFLDQPILIDAHSSLIPDQVLDLLQCVFKMHRPENIILERDNDLGNFSEISKDIDRIHTRLERLGNRPDAKPNVVRASN